MSDVQILNTTPDHDDFRIVALALKVDILQHKLNYLEHLESSEHNRNEVDNCERLDQIRVCLVDFWQMAFEENILLINLDMTHWFEGLCHKY